MAEAKAKGIVKIEARIYKAEWDQWFTPAQLRRKLFYERVKKLLKARRAEHGRHIRERG